MINAIDSNELTDSIADVQLVTFIVSCMVLAVCLYAVQKLIIQHNKDTKAKSDETDDKHDDHDDDDESETRSAEEILKDWLPQLLKLVLVLNGMIIRL